MTNIAGFAPKTLLRSLSVSLVALALWGIGPSTHAQSGDENRDRPGSQDKGSQDKGSQDKGSQDKGSPDKGSPDKGSRDKRSEDTRRGDATRSPDAESREVEYEVEIKGLGELDDLEDGARGVSQLVELEDRPPYSVFQLEDRAKDDVDRIRKFMRSRGYYAAKVAWDISESKKPVVVTLTVTPGPVYTIEEFDIEWRRPGAPEVTLSRLGITPGQPARAEAVVDAQSALMIVLADSGYPFAEVKNRRVVVDHAKRIMRVTLTLDRGRLTKFGEADIAGAPGVDRGLVRRRLEWVRGQTYDSKAVKKTRDELFGLGVFSSVQIQPDRDRIGPDGRAPMRVRLKERKPRSIAISAFYDTSLGPGGEVEWLHRNLFGAAERLTLRVGGTFTEYGVKAFFRKPDIFGGPQTLLAEARYQELDAPAYEGREAVGAFALQRRFLDEDLTVKAGPVYDWSFFRTDAGHKTFSLFGAVIGADYSAVDRDTDPLRGYRLSADVNPYVGSGLTFAQLKGRVNGYWTPPGIDNRVTLAGWTRLGAVIGADRADLPPNKRLYAGGGASIRGFGYQRVGPLNSANNPIGGKSLLEFGLEARLRITDEWGGALFIEGGNVYRDLSPDFSQPFRWGVGVGVRYSSPLGLLRLDLATPLNPRTGDSFLQVYISIGQAF